MAEPGFEIDGKFYEMPSLSSLNIGERRILFELADIVQEELLRAGDESDAEHDERVRKMLRHPGFIEAMLHIGYARGNPKLSRERVQAVIDQANALEVLVSAIGGDAEEDDAGPPDLTNAPERSSPKNNDSNPERSGTRSPTTSDQPDVTPENTGTGKWVTSLTSAPGTSN